MLLPTFNAIFLLLESIEISESILSFGTLKVDFPLKLYLLSFELYALLNVFQLGDSVEMVK